MAIKLKRTNDSEPEIYGNENFGIPKDCTKKPRFNTLKLVFYLVAVAAICVTGYKYYNDTIDRILPEITFDRTNQPLIYNSTTGVVLKTQNGRSYEIGYVADDKALSTVIASASFGKSVFFLGKSDESTTQDLCYYNVNSDDVTVIDKDVSEFKVDADGKFVVYRKGEELRFSNFKDKFTVTENVSEYHLSDNNQAIVFFTDNGTSMYSCKTQKGATPELVDSEITKVVSKRNNHSNVYYIKNSKLYYKEDKRPRELVCDDVLDAIMLGNSVYYTKKEAYVRPLGDFFEDDAKETDETLTLPDGADYIKEVNGLSFFDEEAFLEANNEYEKKLVRDEIREYYEENPVQTEGYSLYMYADGNESMVDTQLLLPNLSYNSCKNAMLYKKNDTESIDKKPLSEVKSIDEAVAISESLLNETPDVDMYLVKERKSPFIAFEDFPTMQTEISLDGKYLYCIETDAENEEKVLTKYEIGVNSLKNRYQICNRVTDFALDGSDSLAVIIFYNNEISIFYEDDLIELSKTSHRDFFFVDGTLFYYDEYDYAKQSGTLCSVRNGKITVVDTNVHEFKVRKYNAVSYIKNYNPERNLGTLYIKEGKTIKRQASYVRGIIN